MLNAGCLQAPVQGSPLATHHFIKLTHNIFLLRLLKTKTSFTAVSNMKEMTFKYENMESLAKALSNRYLPSKIPGGLSCPPAGAPARQKTKTGQKVCQKDG